MRGFLFVFVFCLVPQAAFAVVPMYRLGETYQSEGENGKACLEGHTGFVLSNPQCGGEEPCTQSKCRQQFGDGYFCSSLTKQCEYQECTGPSDTSCSEKYSHMRSCVPNAEKDGGHHCEITCNWDTLAPLAAFSGLNNAEVLDFMKAEYAIWENPSKIHEAVMTPSDFIHNRRDIWNLDTCVNGKVAQCPQYDITKPVTETQWNEMKDVPCIPCVLASGGTYGANADEDYERHAGDYPFFMQLTEWLYMDFSVQNINSNSYESVDGRYREHFSGCANEKSLKSADLFDRLNNHIPFIRGRLHDSDFYIDMFNQAGAINTAEGISLGASPICSVYGLEPRYVAGAGAGLGEARIKTAMAVDLVYFPYNTTGVTAYTWEGRLRTVTDNGLPHFFCCIGARNTKIPRSDVACYEIPQN